MSRRAAVLVLAATIAVAVAIPALADSATTARTASVKGLSVRALARAKAALRTARSAKRNVHKAAAAATAAAGSAATAKAEAGVAKAEATQAFSKASSAREVAGGAELKAGEAKAELALTRPHLGFAEDEVSTASKKFVGLDGGPTVSVDVPPTGLVQVWAQALIEGEGAVSLYEGNQQVEGQAIACKGAKGVLFAAVSSVEPVLAATPAAAESSGTCATLGAPGPVLFRTTVGEHSFELRYAATGAVEPSFSQRRLVVAPLP
jgi:trimeric autotransporter adhesin